MLSAVSSSTIHATSEMVEYDERVLPTIGSDDSRDPLMFDVSTPVWPAASSNVCFLPYVEQIFRKGHGIAAVPVSQWAQLSPCGSLLVTLPCPLAFWHTYTRKSFTCLLEHFHVGTNRKCTILEEDYAQADNPDLLSPWFKVAWLPNPLNALMYAINGANASLVHLIDGRHDHVCCTCVTT